jgi:hypothetical protein
MVSSSAITITIDGECLSRDGFLHGETIRFGSLEFIIECFGGVNLSPQRDGSDVAAMGSTHCGPLSPLWAMTGDSILEFYTVLDGEGGSASPLLKGMARGLRPPPDTTMSWPENTPTTQVMTMIPLWPTAPWLATGLPFKR